jgi:serine/threonine protein kinase
LEWIDGVTLFELSRHQKLSPDLLREVAVQIGKGLVALEQQGLHHGDLSPKNILIDRLGQVKIVDFATGSANDSKTMGTLAYLAPEIWLGDETSLEADLFALSWIIEDAQEGFRNAPTTARMARERAFRSHSTSRNRPSTNSSEVCRNELAKRVRDCLNDKEDPSLQTEVFSAVSSSAFSLSSPLSLSSPWSWSSSNKFLQRVSCLAVGVFLSIGTPVRAEAPLLPIDRSSLLTVTSYLWLSITVDNQDLGYAPIHQKLSAGRHLLKWRTSAKSGKTEFVLSPGQKLHLTNPQDQH